MKFLLVLFMSVFTTTAFACNDFSGKYKDKKSEIYTIVQVGCEAVTYVENNGDRTEFIVDGQYRLTEEDDGLKIFTAANFVDQTLVFDNRIEYTLTFPVDVPEVMIPRTSRSIYSQNSLGDLVNEFTIYNSAGTILWSATIMHDKV